MKIVVFGASGGVGTQIVRLLLRQDPTQTVEAYANMAKVIFTGESAD